MNRLLNIWYKCKGMKQHFKALNTSVFRKTTEKVELCRNQLRTIQSCLLSDRNNGIIIKEEQRLLQELEKWSGIEENIWRHKSRIDWLKLGDSNTKFFYSYVKARINATVVKVLYRGDGSRCTQAQMKEKF